MAFNPPPPQRNSSELKPKGGGLKTLVEAESLLQIAIALPVAVLIGALGGALLDRWLHQHWIVLVGILFGAAGGISAAVRIASKVGGGK